MLHHEALRFAPSLAATLSCEDEKLTAVDEFRAEPRDEGADSILPALTEAARHSQEGLCFDHAPLAPDVLLATRLETPRIAALDRQIATLVGSRVSPTEPAA